jgi:hypothetical protein
MNKKIFINSEKWSEYNKDTTGVPRPFYILSNFFLKNAPFKIAKKIPVPWQSLPIFNDETLTVFNVIEKNESLVISDGRCGYCGIKFKDFDSCSRWTIERGTPSIDGKKGPNVFSDNYPLHKECMRQARIFCPFMKLRNDTEFEFGTFLELKKHAEVFINKHKKIPPVS